MLMPLHPMLKMLQSMMFQTFCHTIIKVKVKRQPRPFLAFPPASSVCCGAPSSPQGGCASPGCHCARARGAGRRVSPGGGDGEGPSVRSLHGCAYTPPSPTRPCRPHCCGADPRPKPRPVLRQAGPTFWVLPAGTVAHTPLHCSEGWGRGRKKSRLPQPCVHRQGSCWRRGRVPDSVIWPWKCGRPGAASGV